MITIPELILIASTRVALGAGLGFLLADRLSRDGRRGAGWALFGIGVATTFPLMAEIGRRPRREERQLAA